MPLHSTALRRATATLSVLLAATTLVATSLLPTQVSTAAATTASIESSASTYTNSKAKSKLYANASTITVSKAQYRGYVQFDVSGVDLSSVVKAQLLLTTKRVSGTKKVSIRAAATSAVATLTAKTGPTVGRVIGTSAKLKKGKQVAITLSDLSAITPTTVLAINLTSAGKVTFYKSGTKAPALRLTTDDGVSSGSVTSSPSPSASPTAFSSPPSSPSPSASATASSSPTASVSPVPSPSVSAASASGVGSVPVGSAAYAVPAGAIFVAPLGTSAGDGSVSNPYGSVQTALSKAVSGATLVLRGGSYHESVEVPFYKKLVIQAYPNEAVWFDGASTLTGFTASGSTWYTPWTYAFDHKVSFAKGADQTSWWVDSAHPMAGYPEQVWIDGVAQTQVSSASAVSAGKFFVDTSAKRLVLGTNPSGKKVEASTLQKAITIHGAGSTLRGFGVRRYATTVYQMGAVSTEVADLALENMVIKQNATIGIYSWGKSVTFNKLTVVDNGLMGVGFGASSGVVFKNSDVSFNNAERFNSSPVAGGLKTSKVSDFTITGNLFEGNLNSSGLWLDEGSTNVTIAGNTFLRNETDGLGVEISVSVRIVNNYAIDNGEIGIKIFDSRTVEVWNNTIANNGKWAIRIMQDDGRADQWGTAYITNGLNFRNNVAAFANAACPLIVLDTQNKMTGTQMNLSFKGNTYHRTSASAPTTFMCWANGSAGLAKYNTLDAYRTATGQETGSTAIEGASILTTDHQLTTTAQTQTTNVPVAVTQTIADLIGVNTGWKGLGAQTPKRTR